MKYYINGIKVRTSNNVYTHAVVCGTKILGCCGSYALAQKKMRAESNALAQLINSEIDFLRRTKAGENDNCIQLCGYNSREEFIESIENRITYFKNRVIEIVELEVRA